MIGPEAREAADWLDGQDSNRAAVAFEWLMTHLANSEDQTAHELRDTLGTHREATISAMNADLPLCKAVEYVAHGHAVSAAGGVPLDTFTLTHLSASMSGLLLVGLDEAKMPEVVLVRLDAYHRAMLEKFLTLSAVQVDPLLNFLLDVKDFLAGLALGDARLFVIELPIGNSLPVALLRHALDPTLPSTKIEAALSRNDSQRIGVTRKQLLAEKIQAMALRPNDIVLYLDEWNTGANFYNLTSILRKCLPAGAFFLPAAFLHTDAPKDGRFSTYREAHDMLLSVWGRPGSDFRRIISPLETTHPLPGYFFWGENDRLAGLRKMQVHGSLFSSIDDAIERLRNDPDALEATLHIHAAELAPQIGLRGTLHETVNTFRAMFAESYADYLICRETLRACADDLAAGCKHPDLQSHMETVMARYSDILENRAAKAVAVFAAVYMKRMRGSDAADRYYFRHHAPVIEPLCGRMALSHQVAMRFLVERMAAVVLKRGLR